MLVGFERRQLGVWVYFGLDQVGGPSLAAPGGGHPREGTCGLSVFANLIYLCNVPV